MYPRNAEYNGTTWWANGSFPLQKIRFKDWEEKGEKTILEQLVIDYSTNALHGQTDMRSVETVQAGALEIIKPIVHGGRAYIVVKRCFDIVFALIGGIIFLLPMLIIALLIRIDSPGPAIFKQERLGIQGKPFLIYKFRSMQLDAEREGPQWAVQNDSRCTRVGRFLRKSRLDELPQFWNILKGDMSFVGPRPERACFYEAFERYIHGFKNRLLVKPGLTGLAQVNGGYDLKPEEKILYDIDYICSRTFALDMKCIFKTLCLVFTHEGAR